jgi:UDP-perosamine 4-acetyltransferase
MTSRRIVIVGAGGHAREVLEVLLACRRAGQDIELLGFIDEGRDGAKSLNGLPVLGDMRWLERADRDRVEVICALGTPSLCAKVAEDLRGMQLRIGSAIAPTAWIAESARVGQGVIIFPNAVVSANCGIGENVSLNVMASISHDTQVGRYCSIGPGARLAGNVTLGERCFVGMGANVVQGVNVGSRSVIGAGAVVLHDLPPGVTAAGVPARILGPASDKPMAHRLTNLK